METDATRGTTTMRRYNVHLMIAVDFEDGDEASDKTVQNYQKQLKDTVVNAARGLFPCSGRLKALQVESVSVTEIKAEL